MCRLLSVRGSKPFEIEPHLRQFARICKESKENQGHGWGIAVREGSSWKHYKNISPVWEDDLTQFGATTQLLAHARSAFKDEGIVVENNMPFFDDRYVFIFNGELRGVKIKEQGRIGAEKIFNYIKRFDKGDFLEALKRGTEIITKQSKYVRAMNIIVSDGEHTFLSTQFSEDPDYFKMHIRQADPLILCSEPYKEERGFTAVPNGTKILL